MTSWLAAILMTLDRRCTSFMCSLEWATVDRLYILKPCHEEVGIRAYQLHLVKADPPKHLLNLPRDFTFSSVTSHARTAKTLAGLCGLIRVCPSRTR